MFSPKHSCTVRRNPFGMWYAQCSCGYEGLALIAQHLADNAKMHHLEQAMKADPMAKWSSWMTCSDLPQE